MGKMAAMPPPTKSLATTTANQIGGIKDKNGEKEGAGARGGRQEPHADESGERAAAECRFREREGESAI